MSLLTSEFNYQRKSHRVDIPLLVEIQGKSYPTKDWSMTGVGVDNVETWLKPEQVIQAKLVLPMTDSVLALNVELQFKSKRGTVSGFEFRELSTKNRRVLRHYIELAIEGKLDNVEDLISVITAPSVSSPIEEALNLSDLESEGLFESFRTRSYVSIGVGIVFLFVVVLLLFYNTVYRIYATGLISGNIERITANSVGVVKTLFVKQNTYIEAGTKLFTVEDPGIDIEVANIIKSLQRNETQLRLLHEQEEAHGHALIETLRQKLGKKKIELSNAQQLFKRRIITIKDYSYVENQYQQAQLIYQRALVDMKLSGTELKRQIKELEQEISTLTLRKELLLQRKIQQTIAAPVRGKIFHIEHPVGSYVEASDIMVLLERDAPPNVLLKLRSDDALKIKIGMSASIYVPATDSEHEAIVAAVGYSSVNTQATITQEASLNETLVRLEFVEQNVRLPANTRVKVWIKTL
ncbi:MAG: hypothetical protein GXP09_11990 [Gammaproteobacteria bacterium]|nr:hypothetical protein [Gammaproteobacteria bacterium]